MINKEESPREAERLDIGLSLKRVLVPAKVELITPESVADKVGFPAEQVQKSLLGLLWTCAPYLPSPKGNGQPPKYAYPNNYTLDKFTKLWQEEDEKIREFGSRWGVLGVCEHLVMWSRCDQDHVINYQQLRNEQAAGFEYLEPWRYFSHRAHALVKIAGNLHLRKPGSAEDWEVLEELAARVPLEHHWGLVSYHLEQWLEMADVRPRLSFSRGKAEITFGASGLLGGAGLMGAIGLQLLKHIVNSKGWVTCSDCQKPFCPSRPPRGRAFCSDCYGNSKPKKALRDAAQRYRDKKVNALNLFAAGTDAVDIAANVGWPIERVQKWIAHGLHSQGKAPVDIASSLNADIAQVVAWLKKDESKSHHKGRKGQP